MSWQKKNISWKAQDIDEANKKVLIYVSSFGNVDSDGDVVEKGAFARTISQNGPQSQKPRIRHLRDHWDLVGKPLKMEEDEKGLLVLSQISNSTKGRDLIEDYKLDMLEHSIGFQIIQEQQSQDNDNVRILKELRLWEYSSVTWGANSETPLESLKGNVKDNLNRLNERMDKITYALRKGDYTDERFEALEFQLRYIQKSYNEIIDSLKSSLKKAPHDPNYVELGKMFDNFKLNL